MSARIHPRRSFATVVREVGRQNARSEPRSEVKTLAAIHFGMKDLCLAFLESSVAAWNLLERADRVGHQPGEETITDLLLLEWQEELIPQLITVAHNKKRESKTGADWEWWFIGRSGKAVGIRIQSKILNLKSNRFEHLHYYVNRKKPKRKEYQCDVLIDASRLETPSTIPLYCLYAWWKPGPKHTLGAPRIVGMPQAYGCSLLSVNDVRRLRAQSHSKDLSSTRRYLIPLHALVCPDALSAAVDLPDLITERLASTLEQLSEVDSAGSFEDDRWVDYRAVEPTTTKPNYVGQMLREEPQVDVPNELRGVVVFRQAE